MTKDEYIDCKQSNNAILFKIYSQCNDNCPFCIAWNFMKTVKDKVRNVLKITFAAAFSGCAYLN